MVSEKTMNKNQYVSNAPSLLQKTKTCISANINQECVWIHFKHLIYDGVARMCRLVERDKNRLEGEFFSPQRSVSLSLQSQTVPR